MSTTSDPKSNGPSTAALIITITVINLAVAGGTDVSGPVRWLLSIAGGILAAAIVHAVVNRHRGPTSAA